MTAVVEAVQAAIVSALKIDPDVSATVSGIFDGAPPRAPFPYIIVGGGLSSDWSTKTEVGRELRIPLTIWDDGEEPARLQRLIAAVEAAMAGLPRDLNGWRIVSSLFLRSMVVRDPTGPWAGLIEHRIRVFAL